jgi:hypothetical protein
VIYHLILVHTHHSSPSSVHWLTCARHRPGGYTKGRWSHERHGMRGYWDLAQGWAERCSSDWREKSRQCGGGPFVDPERRSLCTSSWCATPHFLAQDASMRESGRGSARYTRRIAMLTFWVMCRRRGGSARRDVACPI